MVILTSNLSTTTCSNTSVPLNYHHSHSSTNHISVYVHTMHIFTYIWFIYLYIWPDCFSVIFTTYNKRKTSKDNNKPHLSGFPRLPRFQDSFSSYITSSFSFPNPSQAILFSRILDSTHIGSAYDFFHKLQLLECSLCHNPFALWCEHLLTGYCVHFI